jgi:hypothetical protein
MKSEEFDRAFDDGEDVTSQLDMSAARRPGLEQRRVNVDFPAWMIESLDREAQRLRRALRFGDGSGLTVCTLWLPVEADHMEKSMEWIAAKVFPQLT